MSVLAKPRKAERTNATRMVHDACPRCFPYTAPALRALCGASLQGIDPERPATDCVVCPHIRFCSVCGAKIARGHL